MFESVQGHRPGADAACGFALVCAIISLQQTTPKALRLRLFPADSMITEIASRPEARGHQL